MHECLTQDLSAGITLPGGPIPVADRPANVPLSDSELLARLDGLIRPGLAVQTFRKLFLECRCGIVVARCVFARHECQRESEEVVE